MYLHIAIPKAIDIQMNDAYEEHKGVAATAIVEITKQILLRSNESTHGKSAKNPQATRPTVLVIPIADNNIEA